jgi:hypothetical protein
MKSMKKILALLLVLLPASAVLADDELNTAHVTRFVRWQTIVGVITAQNVSNPVSNNIDSGTFAWSARGGRAFVNLTTGATSFAVDGLVINGTIFSGTPGPVTAVTGTLVCNPGDPDEAALDTRAVTLNSRGDAAFVGHLQNIPATCTNPLFLVRIATPAGAAGRWIATGADRFARQ